MSIVEKALKKKNTNKKNKPNSIDAVEDSIALRLLCRPLIKAENFIVDTLSISFKYMHFSISSGKVLFLLSTLQ